MLPDDCTPYIGNLHLSNPLLIPFQVIDSNFIDADTLKKSGLSVLVTGYFGLWRVMAHGCLTDVRSWQDSMHTINAIYALYSDMLRALAEETNGIAQ